MNNNRCLQEKTVNNNTSELSVRKFNVLGPVLQNPISANPGLTF